MRVLPIKERRITQQPVFNHLTIPGQKVAVGQRVQHRDIGQHQCGLMERADQILALRRINPGFAADRTVHLRQKRGRHLHKPHATAQHGCGETHKVADYSAAQRDHDIAAFDLLL